MKFIFVLFVLFGISDVFGQGAQNVRIFANSHFGNPFYDVTVDIPKLSVIGWDNVARSFQYNGVWLFYENDDYNQGFTNKGIEWAWGSGQKLFQYLDGKVSSLRFAGFYGDSSRNSLTVYNGLYYQYQEEFTLEYLPTFIKAPNMRSLIITGSSPWTVYTANNYGGIPICIYPPASPLEPGFSADIYQDFNILPGSIKSAKIHCDPNAHTAHYIQPSKSNFKI